MHGVVRGDGDVGPVAAEAVHGVPYRRINEVALRRHVEVPVPVRLVALIAAGVAQCGLVEADEFSVPGEELALGFAG